MKRILDEHRHFYVDESGDPNFYGKGKKLIVGTEGCSRTFALGFLRTSDPESIRQALRRLQVEIASDRYLKDIPSIQKTLRAFHANDDCPEVRKLVYQNLDRLEFSVQIIVARKSESRFTRLHGQSQDRFYDDLTSRLFERQLHLARWNTITFARRGNKTRQHALRSAVESGVAAFRSKYPAAADVTTTVNIETAQSEDDPLLQAVDYALWAVQRAYEKGQMRYFEYLAQKFELVWDIYDTAGHRAGTSMFTRTNPFDINKVSPLS